MKLNIGLVLFALFAHSECNNSEYFSMNLSPASQNSIRNILEKHSGITEPEAFIANINELGRTFCHVDKQGSVQLAEAFVRAYNSNELSENEIQNLMKEAVRVGNVNAYVYFSQNIPYLNFDVLEIAATNGQLDIIEGEFAIIEQGNYTYKSDYKTFISAAIRADHFPVIRWFAGKGVLYSTDAKKFLLEALETRNQEIIDYFLQAQIYVDYYNPVNRVNFKLCLLNDGVIAPDSVCCEAARIGNMGVVRYYLDENLPIRRHDLERAQIAAYKEGHTEIADLIGNRIFENLHSEGEHGLFHCRDAKKALITAFEVNNQRVIDYLLYEQIYTHPFEMETRLIYKDRMRIGAFIGLEEVFIKAAEFGNMGVVRYILDENLPINRHDLERAQIAAYKKGHTEIAALIGQRVFENLHRKGEHGLLHLIDVKEALIAALEVNNQRVIDYLLYEQIYRHTFDTDTRLTYEDILRFAKHEEVFIKAAEFGNMKVFQYYLYREFYKTENNLREAQQIARNNGHNDIADSITTLFMF